MTMLSIVQAHCGRSKLPVPASAQSSQDPQILQMVGLLQECFDDLVTRKMFQANVFEATFVSVAAEDQGAINTIAPYGFQQIILESIFDRTQRLPLLGGIGSAEWQARKAFNFTGPLYDFRLRGGRLLFNPSLPAAHTIAFEYQSSYFAVGGVTLLPQQYLVLDVDTCVLGDAIPTAYLRWAWKKEKGFDYAEDFQSYQRLVATASARDARPQKVDMGGREQSLQPGIFVPYGSWNLP
jgi:hypothetical protein